MTPGTGGAEVGWDRDEKQGRQAAWGQRGLRKNSKGGLTVVTKFKGTQILEVKPEGGAEALPHGQKKSIERTLEEAREWEQGKK